MRQGTGWRWIAGMTLACLVWGKAAAQNSFPEVTTPLDPTMASGTVDLAAHRLPVVDLSQAMWRFHPGDDPVWASAGFDDAGWPLLAGNKTWNAQGYPRLGGYAWYRIHLKVQPGEALAFAPGHVFDNYQVFANGRPVATWGNPNPGSVALYGETAWEGVAQIPAELTATGDLVVAIRVWHEPEAAGWRAGGFGVVPKLIGPPGVVAAQTDLLKSLDMVRWLPRVLVFSLTLLAGMLSLRLYLRERRSSEYLWFAVYQITFGAGYLWVFATRHWFPMWIPVRDAVETFCLGVSMIASVVFFFRFIGGPINRPVRWLLYAQIPVFTLRILVTLLWPGHVAVGVLTDGVYNMAIDLTILWLVASYRRRSKAARRLATPMLVIAVAGANQTYAGMVYTLGINVATTKGLGGIAFLFHHPFELTYLEAGQILFLAAMAYVLTERFAETEREKSRLAGEFEAAKTIQQVLIPDAQPEVPGLAIESVYRPAQEVGGDFFQVIPVAGDGALVVIGDVSGHGLQAAMTVSLLVGALRACVESNHRPGEILAGLNRRLHGRGVGFTTCLVLRIDADGAVTAANAGHLQPYLDGVETGVEAGLPLGFTPDCEYAESSFSLLPGSMLTLLTDGVVEAVNGKRELFGFARTQAVSGKSADEIVAAAVAFEGGTVQADDMTVLTIVGRMAA